MTYKKDKSYKECYVFCDIVMSVIVDKINEVQKTRQMEFDNIKKEIEYNYNIEKYKVDCDLERFKISEKTKHDIEKEKTKQDIEKTKQDIEKTKQDIEKEKTKQDIEKEKTKQDIEKEKTKQDIEKTKQMKLQIELFKLQNKSSN
jgi:hypothetical protein